MIGEDLRATPPGMSLVPAADVRRIAIGSDHVGFDLKAHLMGVLRGRGLQVQDAGTLEKTPVDYPDVAAAVSKLVARQEVDAGIVIDGAGIGSAMVANKLPGVRAACCNDLYAAKNSRAHNDANVLAMGGRIVAEGLDDEILRLWLATPFEGGRHERRVKQIAETEQGSRGTDE